MDNGAPAWEAVWFERYHMSSNRTTSSFVLWGVLLLAVVGALYTALSPGGLVQWFDMRRDVERLRAENEALAVENERLRAEAARLESDQAHLERVVRQELGYVRGDEVIFRFPNDVTVTEKKR